MTKIGRNDPCLCGSGKKFKKCCIGTYEEPERQAISSKARADQYEKYLQKHESGHVLNLITALQLIPGNYGKNVRIEKMAMKALEHLSSGDPANFTQLCSIIASEYPRDYQEDLPEELFTENILYHGGNYVVMPGINTHCVDIFNYLAAAIYLTGNNISEQFKRHVDQGICLLLHMGQVLFEGAKLVGNMFEENLDRAIRFPGKVSQLHFTTDEFNTLCEKYRIDPATINDFLLDPADVGSYSLQNFPLLYRPIVKFDNAFYFLLPSSQILAINNYILSSAQNNGVQGQLHENIHRLIWSDVWKVCEKMGWELTNIELPELPSGIPVKEGIFQFDPYMLAYVCYIFPSRLQTPEEMLDDISGEEHIGNTINERNRGVIAALKSRSELAGIQFLTVILTNPMGGFAAMAMERPSGEDEQKTWFSVFDFLILAESKQWGRLTLWKYAKVYEATSRESPIMATSQVDSYSTYQRNGETFYLSDETRPNLLSIVPGDGADIVRHAKKDANMHGALYQRKGQLFYHGVRRCRTYAPIYKLVGIPPAYTLLLETFDFPLWVENFQVRTKNQIRQVENIAEAILFWLDRLRPCLHEQLNAVVKVLLHIVLEFDESYFDDLLSAELEINKGEADTLFIQSGYQENVLTIRFPSSIRKSFAGGDNAGERMMMMEILKAMTIIPGISWDDAFILAAIDDCMPLGPAKMILILDTRTDLLLDNRWLPASVRISDADINLLLDQLLGIVQVAAHDSIHTDTPEEKKVFCNQAASALVRHLMTMLADYDSERLLRILIGMHERIIFDREFLQIKTSAQIHCFSNIESELQNILVKEQNAVNTSLSMRCLIEFIVLYPTKGQTYPSADRVEELLTVMNEVLNFGMLSDSIHFGMSNPNINILPSGRLGMSKEFFDEKLQPFHKDNTLASIEAQLEHFEDRFEIHSVSSFNSEADEYLQQIDNAFLEDWGVSFSCLHSICLIGAAIAERQERSTVIMEEVDFVAELMRLLPDQQDEIEPGMALLRFEYQPGIIDAQRGYLNSAFFPWKYNRAFSFARRPFIVMVTSNQRKYYWGMRQCVSASNYLHQLLRNGTLTHGGVKINSLIGGINKENGAIFRATVVAWLKLHFGLVVWDYEVTMKPNGHFNAEKNMGDCDIVAYDPVRNEVYNIECKKTEAARNIQQMKTEMDAYLGREGQKKKVAKHVERDKWLQSNLDQVQRFVKAPQPPRVKSLIITSQLIPTRYLKEGELPLPIVSFRELKKHGVALLQEC